MAYVLSCMQVSKNALDERIDHQEPLQIYANKDWV